MGTCKYCGENAGILKKQQAAERINEVDLDLSWMK